jgi:hypothetical protein
MSVLEVFLVHRVYKQHFFDINGMLSVILIAAVAFFSQHLLKISLLLSLAVYAAAGATLYFSALKKGEREEIVATIKSFRTRDLDRKTIPLD